MSNFSQNSWNTTLKSKVNWVKLSSLLNKFATVCLFQLKSPKRFYDGFLYFMCGILRNINAKYLNVWNMIQFPDIVFLFFIFKWYWSKKNICSYVFLGNKILFSRIVRLIKCINSILNSNIYIKLKSTCRQMADVYDYSFLFSWVIFLRYRNIIFSLKNVNLIR